MALGPGVAAVGGWSGGDNDGARGSNSVPAIEWLVRYLTRRNRHAIDKGREEDQRNNKINIAG